MSKLRPEPARTVIRKLKKAGFVVVRQRGSHVILENTGTERTAVVPDHGKRDIPRPTLRNIVVRQAGLTEKEYLAL